MNILEIEKSEKNAKIVLIMAVAILLTLIFSSLHFSSQAEQMTSYKDECLTNNGYMEETDNCKKQAQKLGLLGLDILEVSDKIDENDHNVMLATYFGIPPIFLATIFSFWNLRLKRAELNLAKWDEKRNKELEKEREKNFKETGLKETDEERNTRKKISIEGKRLRKITDEAVSKGGLDNYQKALKIYDEWAYRNYFGGIENTEKLILDVKIKIANEYEKLLNYNKAIETYIDAELPDEVIRVRKLIGDDKVKHLDYDKAIEIYESIGDNESAKNARKLKAEQGAVKVSQKVVHGDEVTKTEIKDSVLNRSNVGSGGDDKLTKIKELKELHDAGAIDDDEFKQMKKEILGK